LWCCGHHDHHQCFVVLWTSTVPTCPKDYINCLGRPETIYMFCSVDEYQPNLQNVIFNV